MVLVLVEISGWNGQRFQAAFEKLSQSSLLVASGVELEFAPDAWRYYIETYVLGEPIDLTTLQFGDEAAERDALLKTTFMPPRDLHFITSGIKTVVLGDRGSGKSAIFCALREFPTEVASDSSAHERTVIAASQDPASFVQQMTADDSTTSSADGFKAIWLLYSAALVAREIHPSGNNNNQDRQAFVRKARTILRQIGWGNLIRDESRLSRWMADLRSVLPEKVTLKLGPVTVEPNLGPRRKFGRSDIRIDEFIDLADRLLQSTGQKLLVVFDQIDEAFKYQRDKQESLVQGLFLAEAFLSLRKNIRLIVLLRTDLFEIYDIQEKNKFVSRTVRLDWNREDLKSQLVHRLFSNPDLQHVILTMKCSSLPKIALAEVQLRMVFPMAVEGKHFDEWLFEALRNGKNQVAPRQIILFLNLVKSNAKDESPRRQIPLFTEKQVADAMTRLSELSYQEVISDFRVAPQFVRNCRAGKIMEFDVDKVETLFDEHEGTVALQLERLERLGFIERLIVPQGNSLVSRFRIPRLFTRCWQTSD